jgi:flagellar hook-associated protein 1 FlgK
MSGLLSLLSQASNSLQATQSWSSTVAQNIANANTPGYTRQRAVLAAVQPAEQLGNAYLGRGVMLAGVVQVRDRFFDAQLASATGRHSASTAEMSVLQSVSVLDSSQGVGPALSTFYGALRALAQDPGSLSYREAAVGASTQLALAFNRTGTGLEAARTGVDQLVEGSLAEVNQAASQLAALNANIRGQQATGLTPNDLLDARQRLATRLTQLTGALPVDNAEGDLNLILPTGAALVVGNRAASLSTRADPTNRGHLTLYLSPPDGGGAVAAPGALGGQLGGALTARDGALKTASDSLDQLAFDLGAALNAVHQAGFALDGSAGRDLFTPAAGVTGAALAMELNPAIAANASLLGAASSAATVPGDSTRLQALIATESQPLSTGASVDSVLAQLASQYGSAAHLAQASSEGDQAVLANVTALQQSTSGVSMDEELVEMQKAQSAYTATSKIIKAADDMLSTLLALR